MDAFFDLPPRRVRKAKLEQPARVAVERALLKREVSPPKFEIAVEPVTNTPEDVVATIERVESALRPRRPGDVTNAARQDRWRSKQDPVALRLEAQARMRDLRARRRATTPAS
jgi:hypothetical protein